MFFFFLQDNNTEYLKNIYIKKVSIQRYNNPFLLKKHKRFLTNSLYGLSLETINLDSL